MKQSILAASIFLSACSAGSTTPATTPTQSPQSIQSQRDAAEKRFVTAKKEVASALQNLGLPCKEYLGQSDVFGGNKILHACIAHEGDRDAVAYIQPAETGGIQQLDLPCAKVLTASVGRPPDMAVVSCFKEDEGADIVVYTVDLKTGKVSNGSGG